MPVITNRDSMGRIVPGSGVRHGLSDSPEYDCWVALRARCIKKTHPMYQYYGALGVGVSERWLKSFENFIEDVGRRPSDSHTLDRIDVYGDYCKDNCRWITIQEQQKNRRNNNKFVGISRERDKWRADITYRGQKHFLGRFKDMEQAIKVRGEAENKFWYGI